MKNKKFFKGFLKLLCLILLMTFINLGIKVGMEGMWLFGIPKSEKVSSVTIKYPSLTDEVKEITDREKIELCVHMSGFLKYKPFANAEVGDEPLITFIYNLDNGDKVEVSANETTVFYKGKKHILKNDSTFVNVVEDTFFFE